MIRLLGTYQRFTEYKFYLLLSQDCKFREQSLQDELARLDICVDADIFGELQLFFGCPPWQAAGNVFGDYAYGFASFGDGFQHGDAGSVVGDIRDRRNYGISTTLRFHN